jgi:phage terminase large subunit-like protein
MAGKPFVLEPWQEKLTRDIFGALRPDGTRQHREALVAVPRKNGKTTLGAAWALALLILDNEPGGQVFSAAADKDQARLCFAIAKEMVGRSPLLSDLLEVYKDAIVYEDIGAAYKPISADAFTKHGLNPSGVIFDELHAQKTRELYDVLQTGMGARSQPLMVSITTAGWDRESICAKTWDYARQVADGAIPDAAFYPALWELEEGADWQDEKVWAKCNPNLGVSVSMDFLQRECAKAREDTAYENTFRQLYLNEWTEQAVRYLPMADWDATSHHTLPDLAGQPCYMGVDLSATVDLTAWVLVFPLDDERVAVLPRAYIPGGRIGARERRDRVPYGAWVRDELITATDGLSVDYESVLADITEACSTYKVEAIAVDRWNSTHLQQRLMADGANVVQHGQGFRDMADPTKQLQRLTLERKIVHGGHPVLRWNMANLVVERDAAGNVKPSKKASTEKIDLAVATIMALGVWQAEAITGAGHYETHDLLEFSW